MYLPIKTSDGGYKILKMNEDVLYLQRDGGEGLSFHTFDEEYKALLRVEDWAHYLHPMGFLRIDRGTIVNLHKAEDFDHELRVLVLRTSIGKVTLPVAESMIKVLLQELRGLGVERE